MADDQYNPNGMVGQPMADLYYNKGGEVVYYDSLNGEHLVPIQPLPPEPAAVEGEGQ